MPTYAETVQLEINRLLSLGLTEQQIRERIAETEQVASGLQGSDDYSAIIENTRTRTALRAVLDQMDSGSGAGDGRTPDTSDPAGRIDPSAYAIRAGYGWLQGDLLERFGDLWDETGDPDAALARLRDTGVYERTFGGIKRDDGTLRMDENTYLSTVAGYRETLAEFGMDPQAWASNFSDLIRQEVGAQEFFQTVGQGYQRFREPGAPDNGLLDEFVSKFVNSGSAEVALEEIRSSSAYEQVFAGNRRADGTLRMDEPEYFAYKRGWQRLFLTRGLNPEPFMARGRFVDAVEAEVSIEELNGRLSAVEQGILGNTQETIEFFNQQYGQGWSQQVDSMQSALAMAIDPEVGNDLLARRITASQIGGEAAVQGFARSLERAEELARAGVNQSQARNLYGDAAQRLPGLSATVARFNRGSFGLSDYEDAAVLGDAEDANRLTRALQSEQSSFSSRLDAQSEGFGLTGLRQR